VLLAVLLALLLFCGGAGGYVAWQESARSSAHAVARARWQAAHARWEARPFNHYILVVECAASPANTYHEILEILGTPDQPWINTSVARKPISDVIIHQRGCLALSYTVEYLFHTVQGQLNYAPKNRIRDFATGYHFCEWVISQPVQVSYHPILGYPTRVEDSVKDLEANWRYLDYWKAAWEKRQLSPRCTIRSGQGMSPSVPEFDSFAVLEVIPIDDFSKDEVHALVDTLLSEYAPDSSHRSETKTEDSTELDVR
jgi:hypothetical protein